jgi:hypothetical protein
MSVFVKALKLSKELALRRNAIDDADRVINIIGDGQTVTRIFDRTHMPGRYISCRTDQSKIFHICGSYAGQIWC